MSFEVMVGNKATATGVKLARVKVASAFPVTPQTTITEYLSEMVANGELEAEFVNAEGELSTQVIVTGATRACSPTTRTSCPRRGRDGYSCTSRTTRKPWTPA